MKQDLSLKIRLIYLPFLLLCFSILAAFTLLRFLLSEHWHILNISSEMWDSYLPLIVIMFFVLRYLRPRMRILGLGSYNYGAILYNLAAVIAISMPVYYAQQYVSTAPHRLYHLKSVNDIDTNNVQKYYTIDNYAFDDNGAMSALSWVSGSFKKNIQYSILTATPFYDSIQPKFKVTYWYAYPHDTVLHKSRNIKKTEEAITDFVTNVRNLHDVFKPRKYVYLEALRPSVEYHNYRFIIYEASPYSAQHKMVIFRPVYTPFSERSGHSLLYTGLSLLIGCFTFFWMIFFPSVRLSAYRRYMTGTDKKSGEIAQFFSYLIPGKNGLYVTPVLIWCCILLQMMILMAHGIYALGPENMVLFGGNYLYGLVHGELWRLITYMFLHADMYHLFSNMLCLGIAGAALEPLIRSGAFLGAYFFTGFAAGIISAGAHIHDVSAGASGAIFGLYGTMLGLLLVKYIPKRERWKYSGLLWLYAGSGLVLSFQGNVDAPAHIGGLITGLAFGAVYGAVARDNTPRINRREAYQ